MGIVTYPNLMEFICVVLIYLYFVGNNGIFADVLPGEGCERPEAPRNVLQFISTSNVELNQTNAQFFEIGATLRPVCSDPEQQKLTRESSARECEPWRQWSGEVPSCEFSDERIHIDGDFITKAVQPDGSLSIILSGSTTFVEISCVVSRGNPMLKASHIDLDDSRIHRLSDSRSFQNTPGKPTMRGVRMSPPALNDSGTFTCRANNMGRKESHKLVINFQHSLVISPSSLPSNRGAELTESVINCPNNITVNTEPGVDYAHVYWEIPDFPPGYNGYVSSKSPGDQFSEGTENVYTLISGSGPDLVCNFDVTVVDEEPPSIITCQEDIIRTPAPGKNSVHVSWVPFDVWDNSQAVAIEPVNRVTEGTFFIGQTSYYYKAFDPSGNTAFCNFTITIKDDEPPVFTNCPRNITLNITDPSQGTTIPVTWFGPNITDNSGDYGVNSSSISGDSFEIGATLVSYVAKDGAENTAFCDFHVIIHDDVVPWFINCPDYFIEYTGDTSGSFVSWDEPVARDNAEIELPVDRSHSPGDFFEEGVHGVRYVVRDTSGNTATCEFEFQLITAFCPLEIYNFSSVLLTWEPTPFNQTVSSNERCSVYTTNAGNPLAARSCILNKTAHDAQWQNPELISCGETRKKVDIVELSQIAVVESNVEEVAEAAADVTLNTTGLQKTESIESIAKTLDNIVQVESTSTQVTESVVRTIDNVLNGAEAEELTDNEAEAASRIIQSLEKQVSSTSRESGQEGFQATEPRVAVRTVEVAPQQMINDITFVSFRDEVVEDENGFLHINQVKTVIDDDDLKDVDTSITLPTEVRQMVESGENDHESSVHFSFILFQSDRLFKSRRLQSLRAMNRSVSTSGRVISASVNGPAIANLTHPVVIEFSPHQVWNRTTGIATCVFWDFSLEGGIGDWSSDGCIYRGDNDGRIICHCNHLTSFAVLMDMSGRETTGVAGLVLDIITKMGCVLSIAGLILSLATLLTLRSLRASRSRQILIQLCFSLLCLYVIFLGGVEQTANNTVCLIISALLHYFTLSTLAWMAVEARNMYLLLVRVFKGTESKFMLKACFFAWGTPTIIVILCVSFTFDEYHSPYHCFLRPGYPLYYGLMLPIGLILLHNFVTFGLVVKSLIPSNVSGGKGGMSREKNTRAKQVLGRLQNALIMSVLLGLTWVFGFLAIDKASFTFQLLFCIFNSVQGLLVFFLFCLRSQDVRRAWKAYIPFECNIHGQSYKIKENSYGYHLRGTNANAWHGPMSLGPEDGKGLEYYMYTSKERPSSSSGIGRRYTFTSQLSSNSTKRFSVFSSNSMTPS